MRKVTRPFSIVALMKYPKRYSPFYTLRNGDTGLASFGVEPRDDGIYVEHSEYWKLFEECSHLKAEVERLTLENSQYEEHHKYGQNVITSLREEVERLTKGGDRLAELSETTIWWEKIKKGKQP